MTKNIVSTPARITKALGSNGFFWVVMVLFVLQAGWLALSGRYPMPFDEDFHLGIIKLYANHISPFWNGQPAGSEVFGIVSRDPSYIYHYLMSFPYRLIHAISDSLRVDVVTLRFLNIAFFGLGIYLFRQLLLMVGGSKALVNSVLLVFIFIPVVPLLAAQINYDNVMFPLVAISLILASKLTQAIKANNKIAVTQVVLLLLVGAFCSLVKFAYLPIFLAILIYILYVGYKQFRTIKELKKSLITGYRASNKLLLVAATFVLLIVGGLFIERYAVNTVQYHAPIPECSKVLSEQQCASYGPWSRDHNYALTHTDRSYKPLDFSGEWLYGMWLRSFFSLGGILTNYETRGPLPVPSIAAIVFLVAGLAIAFVQRKNLHKIYDDNMLKLLGSTTVFYIVILWLEEFRSYTKTGQPVAINGRYLVPVFPIILFVIAAAINLQLRGRANLKIAVFAIAFACLLYGGGTATYILRANSGWYWQGSSFQSINLTLKRNVGPWVLGYNIPRFWVR